MKCQTAAAAIAEVAEVGARVFVDLYSKPSEVPHAFQFKRGKRVETSTLIFKNIKMVLDIFKRINLTMISFIKRWTLFVDRL